MCDININHLFNMDDLEPLAKHGLNIPGLLAIFKQFRDIKMQFCLDKWAKVPFMKGKIA